MLAALLWIVLAANHARAEAVAGPALAVSVAVNPAADGTHVLIGFSQIPPKFSIVANDSDQAIVEFADTLRGPALAPPASLSGPLKAVVLDQRGATLTLTLAGAGPLHLAAKPALRQGLEFIVTPSMVARDLAPGALPPHADRDVGRDVFEVVPLKYADVSEIVGLLSAGQPISPNNGFTPQEPGFGSSGISGGGNGLVPVNTGQPGAAAQASANDIGALGQMNDDAVGVDRRLNAIILWGPPERNARLKAKIEALDVPVQSVQLETVFIELTESGARNLGISLDNPNNQIATAVYTYSKGLPGGVDSARSGGVNVNLQAALYAQIAKGEGRILSRPRISAQSGSTAKIITGDALPIVTSIALSGVNAVSQQVQYVNVGVTLQIAPRISADGVVTSHIFTVVSSVTGYSQGYPIISQREASTSATVRDGDYFIIGGLTQENRLKNTSHLPGVGDIPLVGQLFDLHQDTSSKTVLYVIVSPHIVTDADPKIAKSLLDK